MPEEINREVAMNRGDATVESLVRIASPSTLTCPDCDGSLWEMNARQPVRLRCHTGVAGIAETLGDNPQAAAARAHVERINQQAVATQELAKAQPAALPADAAA